MISEPLDDRTLDRVQLAYVQNSKALLENPDDPKELSDRFTLLSTQNRNRAQLVIARRCYNTAPDNFFAVFNYASALSRDGFNSIGMYKRALELAPDNYRATALHHLGLAHHDAKEYEAALEYYYDAQKLAPSRVTEQAISIVKLAMGRLREGLYEFEVRHWDKAHGKAITKAGIPWWEGESLEGKSVILVHEQGFGDTLQFIRFAPLLKRRCKKLVISVSDPLGRLIAETCPYFDDVINEVGPFHADYIVTPMAMTALMGIEYADVTGEPYMNVEPMVLPRRGKLKVGISWRGSMRYRNDALRSSNLEAFAPLFDLPGVSFYSFQVNPAPTEITELGLDGFIADLGSTFSDWRDTAGALAAMDVLVATDSANVHMAGALGVPTLLLLGKNECWRWAQTRYGWDTPWYRSVKILRQERVDEWPMAQVRLDLQRLVRAASSATLRQAPVFGPAGEVLRS